MSAVFQVGIIGVGNMGGAMAQRLGTLGWAPWVHDLDAAKLEGLKPFGTLAPADTQYAASNSVATIVCVVDAAQTRDVLFGPQGIAAHLLPRHVVVLCPTISPEDVEAIAAQLAGLGVDTIDAPMSGGPARARDGSMSLMVEGADAVVARCELLLLQALSSKVFHISARPGDGARTKLVNNLLAATHLAASAEAIALAQRLGLDGAATLAVVAESSGHSWIGADRMARALAGDFAPRAHTTLLAKDSGLALAMAAQAGIQPLLGTAAAAQFQAALAAGFGGDDDARLLSLLQRQFAAADQPPAGAGTPPV